MKPRFQTWRGEDKSGQPLIIRVADTRDAARFIVHTRELVTETDFMLKGPEDTLPEVREQQLVLDFLHRSINCLCVVATRPAQGLARQPILGSLTLTPGRTSRTQHCVQLGMGVLREAWGLGIGGLMLDRTLTWTRSNPILSRVALQVYEDNDAARHLYLSRGFIEEGVMKDEVALPGRWVALVGMAYDASNGDL